jgi:hypothetical protein
VEIHDGDVTKKNAAARRRGRSDLQADPLLLTVQIEETESVDKAADVDFRTIHRAGFRTTEEFQQDWLASCRRTLEDVALIHRFRLVDDVRFLHQRVHRGYTSDPSRAAFGEPEALSAHDLELLERKRVQRDEDFVRSAQRSIGLRARQAAARGDVVAWKALGEELALVSNGNSSATGGIRLGGTLDTAVLRARAAQAREMSASARISAEQVRDHHGRMVRAQHALVHSAMMLGTVASLAGSAAI